MLLRLILALALLAHGAGHIMGILAGLGLRWQAGTSPQSRLLARFVNDGLNRTIGTWLWMSCLAGFVMAGAGLIAPIDQWRSLATSSAAISLVTMGLYWESFYSRSSRLWAVILDLAILLALGLAGWPTDAALGL
ncbi:hypothetical protein [Aggregatilinea lenta]|uniref:hypothetical protein n=1 Tax=Aggregatilinea lenta TaxID=913108 RepID=UPI000E5B543F|nr:hypothetical protein [Aggregatilinea lenta]